MAAQARQDLWTGDFQGSLLFFIYGGHKFWLGFLPRHLFAFTSGLIPSILCLALRDWESGGGLLSFIEDTEKVTSSESIFSSL